MTEEFSVVVSTDISLIYREHNIMIDKWTDARHLFICYRFTFESDNLIY